MLNEKITIIGAGNMGSSLIAGLIKNNYAPNNICATDPDSAKLNNLQHQYQINITTNNQQAVQFADIIIFAIKPQVFAPIAKELKPNLTKGQLIISIAAGAKVKNLENWLGQDVAIVRAMPNTPAMIGCGATALFANSQVTKAKQNLAEAILRAVGVIIWVKDEKLMDAVTAISGSGPAYFFYIMEAMQTVGEELGLDKEAARLLVLQTALGAATMAIESDLTASELRRNVTSPGGTTEKAISVFDAQGLATIIKQALLAADKRSEELGDILSQ
jgi:pyrroline-5-carboxylate reductase